MKKSLKHIAALAVLIMAVLSSCAKEEYELIPRKKLAVIYAEMLMTDQWINDNPDIHDLTDTSLIYEPILMKYGFTSEDYRYSVDVYLDDPERFSRILRSTSEYLDERYYQLKKQKEMMDAETEKEKRRKRYQVDFQIKAHFPYMADEPYVKYYDSLAVEYDTLAKALMIRSVEVKDTIYDRLVMTIRTDTLSVTDSLPVSDTLSLDDSLRIKDVVLINETDIPAQASKVKKIMKRPADLKNLNQKPGRKLQHKNVENEFKELK